MYSLIFIICGAGRSLFRTTGDLALENLALRHQIGVLRRELGDRPARFGNWDRALWMVLARYWAGWRYALAVVQPATVIRWHREGFKRFWNLQSRAGRRSGRPGLDREVIDLIRKMSRSNVTWGAPRIRNELAKLGIAVAVSSVAKYMVRILAAYFAYYNEARCHLSLGGDAPQPRPAQKPVLGKVVELPEVGGLHHRYERAAA